MNLLNKKYQETLENKFVGCGKEDIETALKNATNFKELNSDFEILYKKDFSKTHQLIEDLAHSGDDGKGASLSHKIELIKEKCHVTVVEINDEKLPIINLVIKSECTRYEFLYCITPIGNFVSDGFSIMGHEVLYKDWYNIYCKAREIADVKPKYNDELLAKLRKKYYKNGI